MTSRPKPSADLIREVTSAETHESLLARGAAYCPALAYEVRELPRPGRVARMLLELLLIAGAAAVLLSLVICVT